MESAPPVSAHNRMVRATLPVVTTVAGETAAFWSGNHSQAAREYVVPPTARPRDATTVVRVRHSAQLQAHPPELPVRVARLLLVLFALTACYDSSSSPLEPVVPPSSLAGTWTAVRFDITPDGIPTQDMLAVGAGLVITVDGDRRTTGRLTGPFGSPETDMSGEAIAEGTRVRFQQPADTFVRLLEWARHGDTLSVTDQRISSTRFTLQLVRGR